MADVSIKYRNEEIASLNNDGTKTLTTQHKYCDDNIIIEYTRPSGARSATTTADRPDYIIFQIENPADWKILEVTIAPADASSAGLQKYIYSKDADIGVNDSVLNDSTEQIIGVTGKVISQGETTSSGSIVILTNAIHIMRIRSTAAFVNGVGYTLNLYK